MFADLVLEPLAFPLDPAKRIYWGCLLSSLVLASAATAIRAGRFDLARQLGCLVNRRYWFNASTCTDVGLLLVNNAVRMLILVPALGSRLLATLVVGRLLQDKLGDAPSPELPWLAIAAT